MTAISRIVSPAVLFALFAGCAAQRTPLTTVDPCRRIEIEPSPLWTASAAWTPAEDRLLMIGPGSHSLLVYNLQGELERRVELDPLAALEYASPVRLEATGDGYFVGDKTQILWLDHDFEKRRLWKPFEHLEEAGVAGGSISDFTVVGDTVYAYADFVKEAPEEAKRADHGEPDAGSHVVPGADEPPAGDWYRGFVALDLERPEYVSLHEFALEDEELQNYYFYSKRPYVADLGSRAYVLRYSDPPQVLRSSRRELRPLFAARDLDLDVTALYGWKGRLYLLAWRRAEPPAEERAEPPTMPELRAGPRSHAELMAIAEAHRETEKERWVVEIDPRSGRALRLYRLPGDSGSVKLLPGRSFWALIEESAVPNVDGQEETHLTLLPSSWFQSKRNAAGAAEVALDCPSPGPDPLSGATPSTSRKALSASL